MTGCFPFPENLLFFTLKIDEDGRISDF